MNRRGSWFLWVGVVLLILLVAGLFFYFSLSGPSYNSIYEKKAASGEIVNPASGLSLEEAVAQFNESFVFYILYSIKAYNLHNPPLSSDTPKIEFIIDDKVFSAEIKNGVIEVSKGSLENRDAVIRTSAVEGVKMVKDASYISKSFQNGLSSIELVAGKTTLFAKGYLSLYQELTGKSVTGSVAKIYVS